MNEKELAEKIREKAEEWNELMRKAKAARLFLAVSVVPVDEPKSPARHNLVDGMLELVIHKITKTVTY